MFNWLEHRTARVTPKIWARLYMQGPPLASQTGVGEEYETSDEDDEDYEMQSAEDEDDDEDEDDGDSN